MRRRKLLVVLAGLAVMGAAGAGVVVLRPHRVTRENAARLHPGMTLADVTAILGPPGDYTTGQTAPDPDEKAYKKSLSFGQPDDLSSKWKEWNSDEVWIRALFGPDETVVAAHIAPMERLYRGPADLLRGGVLRWWRKRA
jgi:hypothetical protein